MKLEMGGSIFLSTVALLQAVQKTMESTVMPVMVSYGVRVLALIIRALVSGFNRLIFSVPTLSNSWLLKFDGRSFTFKVMLNLKMWLKLACFLFHSFSRFCHSK